MSRLEDALREALRREEPPEGFAERVLEAARGRRGEAAVRRRWFEMPRLRWAAAFAAVAIILSAGGLEYRKQREERIEAERAKEQVMLALRITGTKLRLIEAAVHQRLNRTDPAREVRQ